MTTKQKGKKALFSTGKKAIGLTAEIAALLIITLQYAKSFSSPATSVILAAYSPVGVTSLMVRYLESIPSLMAIPGAALVGVFEHYMKKKTMLWIAMVCTLIGGMLPGIMPETLTGFYGILVGRFIMGFGRGMIFTMAYSFIVDLFDGKQRDRLMSYKVAVGGIAGSVFQIIGGVLSASSWRYAFFGYAFIIPIILLIGLWLPEPDVKPAGTMASGEKENPLGTINTSAWIIIILALIFNIFQFSFFTNMALAVGATGIGDPSLTGTIMAVETAGCAIGAIIYGAFLKGYLGGFDIPLSIAGEALGFVILTKYISITGYYVGAAVQGVSFGIFNTVLVLQIAKLVPKESETLVISLLVAFQNFGQFISPGVLAWLAPLMGVAGVVGQASEQLAAWNVSWPCMLIFAIGSAIAIVFAKKKHPEIVSGTKHEHE